MTSQQINHALKLKSQPIKPQRVSRLFGMGANMGCHKAQIINERPLAGMVACGGFAFPLWPIIREFNNVAHVSGSFPDTKEAQKAGEFSHERTGERFTRMGSV